MKNVSRWIAVLFLLAGWAAPEPAAETVIVNCSGEEECSIVNGPRGGKGKLFPAAQTAPNHRRMRSFSFDFTGAEGKDLVFTGVSLRPAPSSVIPESLDFFLQGDWGRHKPVLQTKDSRGTWFAWALTEKSIAGDCRQFRADMEAKPLAVWGPGKEYGKVAAPLQEIRILLQFSDTAMRQGNILFSDVALTGRIGIPASRENVSYPVYQWTQDRALPLYRCGETASFALTVTQDGRKLRQGKFTAVMTLDGGRVLQEIPVDLSRRNPAILTGTLDVPGFLRVTLKDFQQLQSPGTRCIAAAGFEPEKIRKIDEIPADFMEFWQEGQFRMKDAAVTLTVNKERSTSEYTEYYVTVKSINDHTLTGFMTIPAGTGPFPAYINVPGAGQGVTIPPPSPMLRKNAIAVAMNVHKFPTRLKTEEQKTAYQEQERKYFYPYEHAGDREKYFYHAVYLGIDRLLDYIAAMPQYDRQHMVLCGGSQGGGSALILAALNKHVTALSANVPALCDHGGLRAGRAPGWPRLYNSKSPEQFAPYYDAANFASFIHVPALLSAGFIDVTCSPSSVYAAYNELKGPKEMFNMPISGHESCDDFFRRSEAFVKYYLGLEKSDKGAIK